MGYLEFPKAEVTNLSTSLKQEFIRTNRAGSYASSTIIFCNRRKYHGLLVCPLKEIDGEHYVLLSSLDETVIQHKMPFNLAIHKYITDYNPLGHKYIESYSNENCPTLIYRVGGVLLKKELILVEEEERILIRYTLLDANSKTTLQLRPFLAFRNIHHLTHSNMNASSKYAEVENGIRTRMYQDFPYLHMQVSKKNEYVSAPDWYLNFEYEHDKSIGNESVEDLLTPGYFECDLKKGESIVFTAGMYEIKTDKLKKLFDSEVAKRTPRTDFKSCLITAANQFISRKGKKTNIIASFPWPGTWFRDSLVSLEGLTLVQGNTKTCQDVLDTITDEIDGYVFRNKGNIVHSNVDSIDTALWYMHAVQQFAKSTSNKIAKSRYGDKILEILETYRTGLNNNVVMHENGLLFLNFENKALTWVDAKINGQPIVKRWGFVVEINALWYNAIQFALELISEKKFQDSWKNIPSQIENSFSNIFWNEELGYLADHATYDYQDFSVRPSQIFATSLPYSPISDRKKHSILEIVKSELLTPKGIRTLSPKNPNYKEMCLGNVGEADFAYHNGSVLMWLLAPYAEAYIKIHGRSGLTEIKRIFDGFEELMSNHGIATISEVYDGNPPHEARGAISQAWSVASALRIMKLIEDFEKQTKQ